MSVQTGRPNATAQAGSRGSVPMIIGGKAAAARSGATYQVHNPFTSEVLATLPDAGQDDIEEAILAARASFESGVWADKNPRDRARILADVVDRMVDEQDALAELETENLGASIRLTTNFLVGGAVNFADGLADLAGRDLTEGMPLQLQPLLAAQMVRHVPVGVVGAIAPWNFPLLSGVFKLFPSLAAGNSVVLKPAPQCPLTTLRLAELLTECGVPDGVVSVVTGTDPALGVALTQHPAVDMVSFTGSTSVGRQVGQQCAANLKRCILELGGKSPVVVLPDADLDLVVDAVLFAVYMSSGQFCEAGTRVLIDSARHDEFVARLVARAETLVLGDPADWATDLGPLVSAAQQGRVLDLITTATNEGSECVTGGRAPSALGGSFVEPTVFAGVRNDMTIAREEVFGPVLAVIPYDDVPAALELANDTPYGLAAAVFGSSYPACVEFGLKLRAGTVWINDYHQVSPYRPFGGFKASGIGREMGIEGIRSYTETQSFYVDLTQTKESKFYSLVVSAE